MGDLTKNCLQCLLFLVSVLCVALSGVLIWRYVHHHQDIFKKPTVRTTTEVPTTHHTLMGNDGKPFPFNSIRLVNEVVPVHYDLEMMTDLDKFIWKGKVSIDLDVNGELHFTVVHVKNLKYQKPKLFDAAGKEIEVVRYVECVERQQLFIEFAEKLQVGKNYKLVIEFNGKLTDTLRGYYRSSYVTKDNKKRYLALTKFEATEARKAFPCFDEPNKKASYTMRMTRAKDLTSTLFNTPRESSEESKEYKGMVTDTFEETVRMSTYLVAWVVSDFAKITDKTSSGKIVNVYAPPHLIETGRFGLSCGVKVLDSYEEFFGVPYPLPKQDLVAIPDFASGAMENWGLIMFKMTALLYDEKVSSSSQRENVGGAIAHEMAHQWFGNLVTMDWWSDLWLNEGFASYLSYHGKNVIDKKWKINDRFVDRLTGALYKDSLLSSHPISVAVGDPSEISAIFDSISYSKGASILRMLEHFIGEKVLRAGLKNYLIKYKYKNTVTNDLWDVLTETMKSMVNKEDRLDVKKIMNTWTNQMGYPVVKVTKDSDGNVKAKQERFVLYTGKHETTFKHYPNTYNYKWHVPLTVMTDKSSDEANSKVHWMHMENVEFKVSSSSKWIKANVNMNGYYRVQYTIENWKALSEVLKKDHTLLSTTDRASLIDDSFSLAQAGLLDISVPMELCEYLVKEKEYVVWSIALDQLSYIRSQIELKPEYVKFAAYFIELMEERLKEISWGQIDDVLENYLRSAILNEAVHLNHQKTIARTTTLFNEMMVKDKSVNPDLTSVVYRSAIENGQQKEWNFLWSKYKHSNDPSEKKSILVALGKTKNSIILQNYLETSLNEKEIRVHDTRRVITSISKTPSGRILAWQFFKQNYKELFRRYGYGHFTMSGIIRGCAEHFTTKYYLDEVREFFTGRNAGSGQNAVPYSLERVAMNVAWQHNQKHALAKWLNNRKSL